MARTRTGTADGVGEREDRELADVVPLFGEREPAGEGPRIEVKFQTREWTEADRMRLLRLLFAAPESGVGASAA